MMECVYEEGSDVIDYNKVRRMEGEHSKEGNETRDCTVQNYIGEGSKRFRVATP